MFALEIKPNGTDPGDELVFEVFGPVQTRLDWTHPFPSAETRKH